MRSYYSNAPILKKLRGGGILLLFFVVIMPPILKILSVCVWGGGGVEEAYCFFYGTCNYAPNFEDIEGGRHIAFVFRGNYAPNFEDIKCGGGGWRRHIAFFMVHVIMPPILKKLRGETYCFCFSW